MWVAASPSSDIPSVLGVAMVSMDSSADLMNNLKLDREKILKSQHANFNVANKIFIGQLSGKEL